VAWTAPMTAISGSVFTAAQFNTFVRDNLNECPASKATMPGSFFVVSDTNQLAERTPATAIVATSQTTTSTSYTDLATVGPAVTVTTGPSALVGLYNANLNSSGTTASLMSYEVTGASAQAPNDNIATGVATTTGTRAGAVFLVTGLTPGSNTFTCRYRVGGGTGTFVDRRILVVPL
jgi:hypothetical protein